MITIRFEQFMAVCSQMVREPVSNRNKTRITIAQITPESRKQKK